MHMHLHTFGKTTEIDWQGLSRQCFLEDTVNDRKLLFTLIDD